MAEPNKTEKPTPKHRRDVEKKGNVARSREVSSALVLSIPAVFILWRSESIVADSLAVLGSLWREFLLRDLSPPVLNKLILSSAWQLIRLVWPFLLVAVLAALAGRLVQGRPVLSFEPLQPKLEKISPKKNLQRVFSSRGLVELAKALALVIVLGWLASDVIRDHAAALLNASAMSLSQITSVLGQTLQQIGTRAGVFLLAMAALDFGFQKYRFERDIRQTRQEVKEDLKQTEGDPLVRQRIRRQQREIATRRMMEDVKRADVVITNPTHYAVALCYRTSEMMAPRVVAKGRGFVALRIREVAEQHAVPVVENPSLTRALHQAVAVGGEIPEELYRAVAQILAYVYRQKQITPKSIEFN